ncbi:hypothetical protein CE91St41_17350 [Oscillospiraceae bacterium]|nr:hypothetical protein CE91St40_20190 [Oscillospiraceae bacterium]BDF74846.1 hypothetical protein CE91St41_17350 [Oscillospiraceae bacterium]
MYPVGEGAKRVRTSPWGMRASMPSYQVLSIVIYPPNRTQDMRRGQAPPYRAPVSGGTPPPSDSF